MKIEIDNVKGFQDILPPESLKRQLVREIIEKKFQIYGFVPIETPVIEFDELMRTDDLEEDEAVSDRFRLKDRAGRNLGLRYEFTFQLARIFKQNQNIKLPFKRYQIGQLFRDEPIGQNRFRQFTQCDVDIIGDSSTNADVECLALVSDILSSLKIKDAEIQVNNRKLLAAIIESVELKDATNIMRELDKIDKIGEDQVKVNLKKYGDSNQILTLFKLLEKDLSFFKENAFNGAKELEELIKKTKQYSINLKFNPFMIRGLGYYTGNIFEVREPNNPTLAAGGRYDNLVGKYLGKQIPAVGISFGLERFTSSAKVNYPVIPEVLLISIEKEIETLKLAKKLRKENISCTVSTEKIGKALEYANALNIPHVIFFGEEEKASNKVKLRNMTSGEEKLLSEKQLISQLKKSMIII